MHTMLALLALAAAAGADRGVEYTARAQADEIHNLPGLLQPYAPKMFSGFIEIGGGKKVFYWHVESEQASQATDPLVLWTSGGPGCSGLGAFFTEQGPFRPQANGTLARNTYYWNQVANMVYIEAPVGVGFSTVPGGAERAAYSDASVAEDNYQFIKKFLERFPHYKKVPMYATSESYGGHYMPSLAAAVLDHGDVPNFKGFFVGNPLIYMRYRDYGQYETMAEHNLLPRPLWDAFAKASPSCLQDEDVLSEECQRLEMQMDDASDGVDIYALDFPSCVRSAGAYGAKAAMASTIERAKRAKLQKAGRLGGYFPKNYAPCTGEYMSAYMNRDDVRAAIHAPSVAGQRWSQCEFAVNNNYNSSDQNGDARPVYKEVMNRGLDIVIYSGDDDAMCSTTATQLLLWDLAGPVTAPWTKWTVRGQVAGFVVKFEGLTFATVHGAGHMVPSTRPEMGLELLRAYLKGTLNH